MWTRADQPGEGRATESWPRIVGSTPAPNSARSGPRHRCRDVLIGVPVPTSLIGRSKGAFTHARGDPMSPATPTPPVTQTIPCTPNASTTATTSGETPMTSGRRLVARIAVTVILAYQALSVAAIIANPQWNPLT